MKKTFNPPHPLKTPVLFLVFKRLDTTKQVFKAIRQAKPPRLYVAADGARQDKEGEEEDVQAVRDYIINNIDWECKVKTLFREKNLGCKYAVHEAIQWFFKHESNGIILEDDCLPSQSFFWYCEDMLGLYKDDLSVAVITGRNELGTYQPGVNDHFFSLEFHPWGWASWRNRVEEIDVELGRGKIDLNNLATYDFIEDRLLLEYKNRAMRSHWVNTWDWPYDFNFRLQKRKCIYPINNYVKNIGFGKDGTHTTQEGADSVSFYDNYYHIGSVCIATPSLSFHRAYILKIYGNWLRILIRPYARRIIPILIFFKKKCQMFKV